MIPSALFFLKISLAFGVFCGSIQLSGLLLLFLRNMLIFLNLFYLFIFGCVGASLLLGLSLVVASRGYSSLQCVGVSLQWLLLLQSMGSRHMGFGSCGAWS